MTRLLAALSLAFLVAPAAAQDRGVVRTIDETVTNLAGDAGVIAGAGVGLRTQPYEGDPNAVRVFPVPMISYEGGRFQFIGKTLSGRVWSNDTVTTAVVADLRFQGYDADDSYFLQGMDDRSWTIEAGGRLQVDLGRLDLSARAVADVLSRHGGWEGQVQAGYELSTWRPLSVIPYGGTRYQSSSLTDYYFGVDPDEALFLNCAEVQEEGCLAVDRPAYEVGSAWTPYIGVSARQALSRKVAIVGGLEYSFLSEVIDDSPIVDDDKVLFGFLGAVYLFGDYADR